MDPFTYCRKREGLVSFNGRDLAFALGDGANAFAKRPTTENFPTSFSSFFYFYGPVYLLQKKGGAGLIQWSRSRVCVRRSYITQLRDDPQLRTSRQVFHHFSNPMDLFTYYRKREGLVSFSMAEISFELGVGAVKSYPILLRRLITKHLTLWFLKRCLRQCMWLANFFNLAEKK